jgi:hypothetical protein
LNPEAASTSQVPSSSPAGAAAGTPRTRTELETEPLPDTRLLAGIVLCRRHAGVTVARSGCHQQPGRRARAAGPGPGLQPEKAPNPATDCLGARGTASRAPPVTPDVASLPAGPPRRATARSSGSAAGRCRRSGNTSQNVSHRARPRPAGPGPAGQALPLRRQSNFTGSSEVTGNFGSESLAT